MSTENSKILPPNAVTSPNIQSNIQVIKLGSKPENSKEPLSSSVSDNGSLPLDSDSVETKSVESVASSKSSSGADSDSDKESDSGSDVSVSSSGSDVSASSLDSASSISTTSTVNKLSSDPLFFVLSQFLMNDNGNIVDSLNNIDTTLKAINKNLTALKKYHKNMEKETTHRKKHR